MSTKLVKQDLLEFFYDHVQEPDWLEGLDLYQAGRVQDVQVIHGLVTGRVGSNYGRPEEVRIKLHPAGHCIQWIECTCKKNRVQSRYCEHISSMMIHIDRENPKVLGKLDSHMPIKPPLAPKRSAQVREAKVKREDQSSHAGAAEAILEHLSGKIHSVSLLAKGPSLRVRLEIKDRQLTHYDLKLDQAAKFLLAHPRLKSATQEVRDIKVYKSAVELGTRIFQTGTEEFVAERVVAIRQTNRTGKGSEAGETAIRLCAGEKPGKESRYEFFGLKAASKSLGKEYFFQPGRGYWPLNSKVTSSKWSELPIRKAYKDDQAARLVQSNFEQYVSAGPVWISPELEKSKILEVPSLSNIHIHAEEGGWFILDPRYEADTSQVSMADLMQNFRKKKRAYVKSGNVWIKIPELVTEHGWQLDETGAFLKVDTIGLMRLKAAVGDFDQFVGSKRILHKIRNRMEFKPEVPAPSLKHTNLNLREYQLQGLNWLWWLFENQLHGLLADEMGLGKTHQAMALLSAVQLKRKNAKFLVVAPTTVLDHWYDKVRDFCPNLKPMKHHGPRRTSSFSEVGRTSHAMITSYGVILRDIKKLSEIEWDALILDEAHFVKNSDTATYHAVCRLRSSIRICLTGTPMENHLGELKNIFDFLLPGYLGSDEFFQKNFLNPIGTEGHPENELQLQKLIFPFKLRRTKELVLKELPEKVEDYRHCGLSAEQARLYKGILEMKARPLVEQLQNESKPIPYLHVFATLTMLKQVCNHPALIMKSPDYQKHSSEKFELLKELINEALASNHKVVIYSQYVEMINIIAKELESQGIGHVTLTGKTRNRGRVIERFQTEEQCQVFIGSLLAGGIGIDLTAASVVIHYDRWWNASKENQATDRVHRIGQNKNVQVIKLITRGTLEEKIDRLIGAKRALFEKFMNQDEEIFKNLSRQELIDLLH